MKRPGVKSTIKSPRKILIILEAETITRLNQIAEAVSKNSGLNISRGEIIRAVLVEYVRNSDI